VRYRRVSGTIVVSLDGEIDLSNAAAVDAEIKDALDGRSPVVIDLTGTTYIDSAGLRLLFALARSIEGGLNIVIPERSPIRRVVSMVGLGKVATLVSELPGE
jgi:stage II sporulation protein AA (anti-sigma F factor antagonist)